MKFKLPPMLHHKIKTGILCWAAVAGECIAAVVSLLITNHYVGAAILGAVGVFAAFLAYTSFDDLVIGLDRAVRDQITKELTSKP